uniref:Uncharacterized protein n=1 Tax=Salarias fasciatus TaxID=181472 RepID=A0A672FSJ0_SALFA
IRPISNTVEIFVTGLEAASFSFLASNFGLKSSTGIAFSSVFSVSLLFSSIWCMMFSLEENIWKRTASHILTALGEPLVSRSSWAPAFSPATSFCLFPSLFLCSPASFSGSASGNLGSSCSTTMCFLRRDQPLALVFMPFGFGKTFRRGSAAGRGLSTSLSEADVAAEAASALVWALFLPRTCFTSGAVVMVSSTGVGVVCLTEVLLSAD